MTAASYPFTVHLSEGQNAIYLHTHEEKEQQQQKKKKQKTHPVICDHSGGKIPSDINFLMFAPLSSSSVVSIF